MSTSESEGEPPGDRSLRLSVTVQVGTACPLTDVKKPISSVQAQQIGDTCECEVVTDAAEVLRLERERPADCLADVFHRHGCVPHLTDVHGDALQISVHPPDRESVEPLLNDLRTTGYDVTTRRIRNRRAGDDENRSLALVDRSRLTDKQRRAVELALERGYYDDQKRTTLCTLAEELDISKSAFSRRLSGAESKLVRGAFGGSS